MDDTISRAKAIFALSTITMYKGSIPYDTAVMRIKQLPSAQPEQRPGEWIPQDHNKRVGNISTCVYYYPTCSECGQVGNDTYKYCPHCGAKMEVTT